MSRITYTVHYSENGREEEEQCDSEKEAMEIVTALCKLKSCYNVWCESDEHAPYEDKKQPSANCGATTRENKGRV